MLDDAPPIAPEELADEVVEEAPINVEEDTGDDHDLYHVEEVHRSNEYGEEARSGNSYASGERPWGRNVVEYIYRGANGAPYLRVVRMSAKQFPQYHRENDRWVTGKPAGPKIPYRLPELIAAAPTTPVFICEGEKDADSVAALGLVATTNSEGAGKWTGDLNEWFKGKQTVYILEDNDDAGRNHAAKVAAALHGIVSEIRVVSFPELPDHGDVSDWLKTGGNKALLLERARTAKESPHHNDYTLVRACEIRPRAMDWLWEGHLLRGSLELLTGPTWKRQVTGALSTCGECHYRASVARRDQRQPGGQRYYAHSRGLSRSNHYPAPDCGQGKSRARLHSKKDPEGQQRAYVPAG
jgi:Toprim domain-containing protein